MPIGIDMNNYDISMGTGQIRMSGGGTFTSDNSINYDWISRASPDYTWWGACFGNGLFVVVSGADGSNNSVMTSPDGINWTLRTTPNPGSNWRAVAFGTPTSNPNGLFVAVADGGPGSRLMTSTNGIVWTARDISSNTNNWANVAYGSGYFVAVSYGGNSNRIMYSSNGINWTDVTINNTFTAHGIAFANGRFVVTPIGGSNNAYYTNNNLSTNPPSSWAQSNNINALRWPNVAYGNGLFVAVSEGPTTVATNGTGQQQLTSHVMTSPDGITWTNRYSPDTGWVGITYGAGMFVVVAIRGAGNRVMTSPDGINWTLRPSVNDSLGWYGITYGNGIFVAASYIGSGNRVMTLDPAYGMSINKITTEETTTNLVKFGQNGATISANPSKNFAWVARNAAEANGWHACCYGNGQFVAVAFSGTNRVMTSTDGYTWTAQTPTANNWLNVCYGELSGNNLYVAVGHSGTNRSMYSTNGISWTTSPTPNDASMEWACICFGYDTSGNGLFVGTAINGTTNLPRVMTSSNGINWTPRNASDNALSWRGVCYGYDSSGQGQFVAVAQSGTGSRSMYSINGGVTWVGKPTTEDNSAWYNVCYGNGTFVAVAAYTGPIRKRVMYSRNIIGAGWSEANYPVENDWWGVAFGNGLFVATAVSGVGNRVMTSPDGINWTIRASVADSIWKGICYGNGTFVSVSSNGTVMTNDYTANDNTIITNGSISSTGLTTTGLTRLNGGYQYNRIVISSTVPPTNAWYGSHIIFGDIQTDLNQTIPTGYNVTSRIILESYLGVTQTITSLGSTFYGCGYNASSSLKLRPNEVIVLEGNGLNWLIVNNFNLNPGGRTYIGRVSNANQTLTANTFATVLFQSTLTGSGEQTGISYSNGIFTNNRGYSCLVTISYNLMFSFNANGYRIGKIIATQNSVTKEYAYHYQMAVSLGSDSTTASGTVTLLLGNNDYFKIESWSSVGLNLVGGYSTVTLLINDTC